MQKIKIEGLNYSEACEIVHRVKHKWNLDYITSGGIISAAGQPSDNEYNQSIIIYGSLRTERRDLLKTKYPYAKIWVEMKNKESK